jgi:hypothetical protein
MPRPAPGAPAAESEALQQRVRQLEEDVKRKVDPEQAVRLTELANLKERLRRLEEESRADQQKIFETYRKHGPAGDPAARTALNREIGGIQMQIARRGQEQNKLRADIARLEAEAGTAPQSAADKGK